MGEGCGRGKGIGWETQLGGHVVHHTGDPVGGCEGTAHAGWEADEEEGGHREQGDVRGGKVARVRAAFAPSAPEGKDFLAMGVARWWGGGEQDPIADVDTMKRERKREREREKEKGVVFQLPGDKSVIIEGDTMKREKKVEASYKDWKRQQRLNRLQRL
jgi:hypothetical protein